MNVQASSELGQDLLCIVVRNDSEKTHEFFKTSSFLLQRFESSSCCYDWRRIGIGGVRAVLAKLGAWTTCRPSAVAFRLSSAAPVALKEVV